MDQRQRPDLDILYIGCQQSSKYITNVLASWPNLLCWTVKHRHSADEASPPTDEASPIGPYIFLIIIFLSFSAPGVLPSESAFKSTFRDDLC